MRLWFKRHTPRKHTLLLENVSGDVKITIEDCRHGAPLIVIAMPDGTVWREIPYESALTPLPPMA